MPSAQDTLGRQLPADMEKQIRDWLETHCGHALKQHPGPSVQWGFQLVSSDGTITEVYQMIDRVDHIVVSQKCELVSTLKNLLEQLDDAGKAQLYFELRAETFRSECQINIRFVDRTPQGFQVVMPIFADALTQDTLFYRINKVSNTAQLLLALLNRAALNYPKREVTK